MVLLGLDTGELHKIELGALIYAAGQGFLKILVNIVVPAFRRGAVAVVFAAASSAGNEVVKNYVDRHFRKSDPLPNKKG